MKHAILLLWHKDFVHLSRSIDCFDDDGSFAGYCFDGRLSDALGALLIDMGIIDIVDLGCGSDWYVEALRRKGFSAVGYDGNPDVGELSARLSNGIYPCEQADLTDGLVSDEPFDLVLCLGVGEHIPFQYENRFFQNLACNSGCYIIMSWAVVEGQSDCGKLNCHSNQYVIDQLYELGFSENVPAKNFLRRSASLECFKNTILVFQKDKRFVECNRKIELIDDVEDLRRKLLCQSELIRQTAFLTCFPELIPLRAENKVPNKFCITDQHWKTIFYVVNNTYPDFIPFLKSYPIVSQDDIRLCCMLKLGVSIKELAVFYHLSTSAVYKKKDFLLKQKLNLPNGVTLDSF